MKQINEEDYTRALNKPAEHKLKTLINEKDIFIKNKKLQNYLLQKGYESELIRVALNVEELLNNFSTNNKYMFL